MTNYTLPVTVAAVVIAKGGKNPILTWSYHGIDPNIYRNWTSTQQDHFNWWKEIWPRTR